MDPRGTCTHDHQCRGTFQEAEPGNVFAESREVPTVSTLISSSTNRHRSSLFNRNFDIRFFLRMELDAGGLLRAQFWLSTYKINRLKFDSIINNFPPPSNSLGLRFCVILFICECFCFILLTSKINVARKNAARRQIFFSICLKSMEI